MDVNQIETTSNEQISKINSAALVNITLTNLWNDNFRHFRLGKFLSANSDLDCIWTILGGEKNIKGTSTEKEYNKIEKRLSETGNVVDSIQTKGFNTISKDQLTRFSKQKDIILEKALFLRRLQNTQGKGTAYYDGSEEDMD